MNKIINRLLIIIMIFVFFVWVLTFGIFAFIFFGPDAAGWPMKIIVDLEEKI